MKISAFTFNPFGVMTYVLWDPETLEAAVVDPGMTNEQECDKIDEFINKHNLKIKYLINTHMHLDHIFGDKHIEQQYGVGVSASSSDARLGRSISQQAARFGMRINASPVEISHQLHDGDTLTIGNETLKVIEVPGHSQGSIALYCPESGFLISGDTLFNRGVGRTDLEGGDSTALSNSIRNKLFKLPDNTLVCPGHGPTTTIGQEKHGNPYV